MEILQYADTESRRQRMGFRRMRSNVTVKVGMNDRPAVANQPLGRAKANIARWIMLYESTDAVAVYLDDDIVVLDESVFDRHEPGKVTIGTDYAGRIRSSFIMVDKSGEATELDVFHNLLVNMTGDEHKTNAMNTRDRIGEGLLEKRVVENPDGFIVVENAIGKIERYNGEPLATTERSWSDGRIIIADDHARQTLIDRWGTDDVEAIREREGMDQVDRLRQFAESRLGA